MLTTKTNWPYVLNVVVTLEPGSDANPIRWSLDDGPGTNNTWLDHVAFAELSVLLGFATHCEVLEFVSTDMNVRKYHFSK